MIVTHLNGVTEIIFLKCCPDNLSQLIEKLLSQ